MFSPKAFTAFSAAALLTAATISNAAPVASEDFTYPDGDLAGNNGGSGWGEAWATLSGPQATVASGTATFTFASTGAYVGSENSRALPATIGAGTTTWIRFDGRMSSSGQVDNSFGGLSLYNGSTESLLIGKNWPGPENWTLTARDSSYIRAVYESTISLTDPAFDYIWLKIVNGGGTDDDSVSLWINPADTSSESALGTPLVTHTARHLDFDSVRLRGGTDVDGHTETWTLDQLAIASDFATISNAAPVASEDFTYPDGDLAGNNGGSGWGAAWTTLSGLQATVASGTATFTFASTGDYAGSENSRALFATIGAGTTTWIRFDGRMSSNGQVDNSFGGLSLYNGSTESLLIGKNWPGPENWTLTARDSSDTRAVYESTISLTDPGFDDIWLKIVKGGGTDDDSVSLWINPADTSSESALGTPLVTHTARQLNFDSVRLRGGTDVNGHSETWSFDDIKLGPDFADVADGDVAGGFASWALANGVTGGMADDDDNDGVDNGIEFFMGDNNSGFTAMPVPDANRTITWPKGAQYNGAYGTGWVIETSSTLQAESWNPVAEGEVQPAAGSISYTLPANLGKIFARLKVMGPQ
jgi:hypothetical protein